MNRQTNYEEEISIYEPDRTRPRRAKKPQKAAKPTGDHCPVKASARRALSEAADFLRKLRSLRSELEACRSCSRGFRCPTFAEINAQIDAAVDEISDEWAGRNGGK